MKTTIDIPVEALADAPTGCMAPKPLPTGDVTWPVPAKGFKNPGNGEDTWNGVERMDEWLDPKRYLLNGQEYMELVDSIHKPLGYELARNYPEHTWRGAECPGGRDSYKGHAESYLKIGEAMGKAMLELTRSGPN